MLILSSRFEEALVMAVRLHREQLRKASGSPYIAHLLSTAALVLEDGGDEDEAIAALLHDAVEDQGGRPVLEKIRAKFGERVARIVDGCTDAYEIPKPPWMERKLVYLEELKSASAEVRRVSLADKLHNARTLLGVLRREGDIVWERFNGGRDGTIWYFNALLRIFQETGTDEMTEDFGRIVVEITDMVNRQA